MYCWAKSFEAVTLNSQSYPFDPKIKLNYPWPKMLWHNCFRSINYSTKKKDALIILLGYDTIFDQKKKRNAMILLMQIPRALRLLIKDTQFG